VCWFITVGVPKGSRHLLDRLRHEREFLQVTFADSTPTTRVIGPGQECAVVTRGGCSCDLVREASLDPSQQLEQQRLRLVKKGLSEAKIRQALDAKAHALTKPDRSEGARRNFLTLVSALVEECPSARFFSHFYRGNIIAEEVVSNGAVVISMQTMASTGLPPDTLVTIGAMA
jgi:hypothetical protein